MYMKRATEKYKRVKMVKSKPKALQHFKVDPVLKIDETFYKQAESMCALCPTDIPWICKQRFKRYCWDSDR